MKKISQPKRVIIIVLFLLLTSIIFSFWLFSQNPTISVRSSTNDWPMFHRDLTHTGYSNSSAPLTPDIMWKFDGGHVIWASPAVVDGHIFIASDDTQVYCLDALTGEQVWRYRTKNALGSSAAVAGGYLYVGSYDRNIYCLDAATGTKIW
ncbi:MAG TPA: PQQ-binding-like beta-propeller repeat protein, partial [Candidatus Glassbacteria bacterium]|nr:PQQ-binding-like beta-propeller repeat protein [Candidatus Glassbacteria bacterium]